LVITTCFAVCGAAAVALALPLLPVFICQLQQLLPLHHGTVAAAV